MRTRSRSWHASGDCSRMAARPTTPHRHQTRKRPNTSPSVSVSKRRRWMIVVRTSMRHESISSRTKSCPARRSSGPGRCRLCLFPDLSRSQPRSWTIEPFAAIPSSRRCHRSTSPPGWMTPTWCCTSAARQARDSVLARRWPSPSHATLTSTIGQRPVPSTCVSTKSICVPTALPPRPSSRTTWMFWSTRLRTCWGIRPTRIASTGTPRPVNLARSVPSPPEQ
mmetsp:Transcript_3451/g.9823  ORF Transcript_3451/g.9823 Transcript_3451/m.9823 type:complete len:223 (-) Transcript_3451:773-1441(-)